MGSSALEWTALHVGQGNLEFDALRAVIDTASTTEWVVMEQGQ